MIFFIDASFWGTYPAWGSFIVALGGLIFVLIRMLSKKVDHVEGLVKELQEQNKILSKDHELNKQRFEHETRIPIIETRPVFKRDNQLPFKENSSIQLILINDGTKAQEIKRENASPEKATWHATLRPAKAVISKGDKLDIMIYSADISFEGIEFDISYYGEDDIKHVQHIAKKYGGNFQIESPA